MALERVDHRRVGLDVAHGEAYQTDPPTLFGGQLPPALQALAVDRERLRIVGDTLGLRAGQDEVGTGVPADVLGEAAHHPEHVLEAVPP